MEVNGDLRLCVVWGLKGKRRGEWRPLLGGTHTRKKKYSIFLSCFLVFSFCFLSLVVLLFFLFVKKNKEIQKGERHKSKTMLVLLGNSSILGFLELTTSVPLGVPLTGSCLVSFLFVSAP